MHYANIRWFHGLSAIFLSAAIAACAAGTSRVDQMTTSTSSAQKRESLNEYEARLNVMANGLALTLDRSHVNAGTVTFSVKNAGTMPHNFAIQGNGVDHRTAPLMPGETTSLTVDLQPGIYTYRCTVHFHYILGMKGALTVTGS
jgi:plastocyanin